MANHFESLVDRITGTPLRRATTIGVSGAALSSLLFELVPETRQYGIQHNLLVASQALPVGFVGSYAMDYLREGARYAACAYQRFRGR